MQDASYYDAWPLKASNRAQGHMAKTTAATKTAMDVRTDSTPSHTHDVVKRESQRRHSLDKHSRISIGEDVNNPGKQFVGKGIHLPDTFKPGVKVIINTGGLHPEYDGKV